MEEGEIPQQEEAQVEETSHLGEVNIPTTSQVPTHSEVIVHSIDSDFDQEEDEIDDENLGMDMMQSETAQQFLDYPTFPIWMIFLQPPLNI